MKDFRTPVLDKKRRATEVAGNIVAVALCVGIVFVIFLGCYALFRLVTG